MKRHRLLCVVLAFALYCWPGDAHSDQRELALEIRTHKQHYLPDEPLFVRIALTNDGTSDAWTPQLLNPDAWYLVFEVGAPGAEPHRYYGRGHGDMGRDAKGVNHQWHAEKTAAYAKESCENARE